MRNSSSGLLAKNNVELESTMKTVKSITRPHFEIRLIETDSGAYRVCYSHNDKTIMGEPVSDYSLAARMFDLKLIELEGH